MVRLQKPTLLGWTSSPGFEFDPWWSQLCVWVFSGYDRVYGPECLFLNFDRLLRRQLQPLHQGLPRPRKTRQFLELPCILFLRFKLMYQCCWVELCLLISFSLQTNLIFGGWWECGPFGCSVSSYLSLSIVILVRWGLSCLDFMRSI